MSPSFKDPADAVVQAYKNVSIWIILLQLEVDLTHIDDNYVYIHFRHKSLTRKQAQKTDISREQHSKQANIRQGKLWKVTRKVKVCWPSFNTFRYIYLKYISYFCQVQESSSGSLQIVQVVSVGGSTMSVVLTWHVLILETWSCMSHWTVLSWTVSNLQADWLILLSRILPRNHTVPI